MVKDLHSEMCKQLCSMALVQSGQSLLKMVLAYVATQMGVLVL